MGLKRDQNERFMPAGYKYEFISLGRAKALARAATLASDIYHDFEHSNVIAPAVLERLRNLRALIARAANQPMGDGEILILEEMFGKDLGEEKTST